MRGLILRALPVSLVAFTTGCFTTNYLGPPMQPRTATHAYWQQVNTILARKPASGELKTLVETVRIQTDALRELSPEGVDADLAAAVDEIIKCEEDVLWRAEAAGNDVGILKTSQAMAVAFADANRKAAEAKKKLKALRGLMNDRYGGGF